MDKPVSACPSMWSFIVYRKTLHDYRPESFDILTLESKYIDKPLSLNSI